MLHLRPVSVSESYGYTVSDVVMYWQDEPVAAVEVSGDGENA